MEYLMTDSEHDQWSCFGQWEYIGMLYEESFECEN